MAEGVWPNDVYLGRFFPLFAKVPAFEAQVPAFEIQVPNFGTRVKIVKYALNNEFFIYKLEILLTIA